MSYQEVADKVEVSKVTVFNHLSQAIDWIRKQFKKEQNNDKQRFKQE